MSDNSGAEACKTLGNESYKKKQFEDALKHYDEAIELDGTNIVYYTNKAAVFFEQQKYDECVEVCMKAIEVGREHRAEYKLLAKPMARAGNAYWKQGKLNEALQWIEKSLSEFRDPELVKKQKQIISEVKEADRKAYINPELAEEQKQKGNKAFKEGNFPEAVKAYTEAIKRDPDNAVLYSNRSAAYLKLMEFPRVISDCDEALKLDPKSIKAYVRKGSAYLGLKEKSKARHAYEQALELDPNNKEANDGVSKSYASEATGTEEETRERALKDPEIQKILSDPAMQAILQQMSTDPTAARDHMKNPEIMAKIMKLIDAGVVGQR
uniref:Stress-induced-phosphoprotein 1 n=1 Tax=Rhabditophanes sp. KR3021 TaxID=114890 RepID=A0AC35TGC4_9BILA